MKDEISLYELKQRIIKNNLKLTVSEALDCVFLFNPEYHKCVFNWKKNTLHIPLWDIKFKIIGRKTQ